MKKYTALEIIEIIDAEIKKEINLKNTYIALNGYDTATLKTFDSHIAALTFLLSKFK